MPTPLPSSGAAELIAGADLAAARRSISGVAVHTPTIACEDLAELAGTPVALKAESLQGTGSFKLRGALRKVAALGERARAGLVTASAGNHGRAVARAAAVRGVRCEVFMPRDAAVSKVAEVERLGAQVQMGGASVEEALALAAERAQAGGPEFVHPFDDLDVIAGQGTLGLELLEDVPGLARAWWCRSVEAALPAGSGSHCAKRARRSSSWACRRGRAPPMWRRLRGLFPPPCWRSRPARR